MIGKKNNFRIIAKLENQSKEQICALQKRKMMSLK